jgi:formylglycine-generating enzyme required for sulfatase activity
VVQPGGGVQHLVRHPVDGKLMTFVEAGPYARPGLPTAWLTAYYIDVLPTTCAEYQQFIAGTGHRSPVQWKDGELTDGMADTPVQVPWIDAQAYARWASKVLPTSAQWERAATGEEGLVTGHLAEWCGTDKGPRRRDSPAGGKGHGLPTFRCGVPADELLRLLAI